MKTKLDFSIAVAQMRPKPGNIRENIRMMKSDIATAKEAGAALIVFPEMSLTGYLLGDMWEDDDLMLEVYKGNEQIREALQGIVGVWGSVRIDTARTGEDGRMRKYNAALIAQNGKWVHNGVLDGWMPKTNHPNYRWFDDSRHFYSATKLFEELRARDRVQHLWQLLQPFRVSIGGTMVKLGLGICEDFWQETYNAKPTEIYGMHGVDLLVDISSSPQTVEKWHAREGMLVRSVADAKAPILYVNIVGLQNNAKNLVWFDGASEFRNVKGELTWAAPQNKAGLYTFNPSETNPIERPWFTGIRENYEMTIEAMRDFYADYKRVIIGLSGGIDSALGAAMLVEALGPERILAINMPTPFNSATTKRYAQMCATNLGIEYRAESIWSQVEERLRLLKWHGYANVSAFDLENIQARIRGQVLADLSAVEATLRGGKVGFSCNGNKTELALNYFTEYGDGAGTACFFGDDLKGDIYALARYVNEKNGIELIPMGIIEKLVPSAELSVSQNVDEGKGDPIKYPYHDKLVRKWIEKHMNPARGLESYIAGTLDVDLGCEEGTVKKYFPTAEAFIENLEWAWRGFTYAGKRHKLPPNLSKERRSFGFDWRATIVPPYYTDRYYELNAACLK